MISRRRSKESIPVKAEILEEKDKETPVSEEVEEEATALRDLISGGVDTEETSVLEDLVSSMPAPVEAPVANVSVSEPKEKFIAVGNILEVDRDRAVSFLNEIISNGLQVSVQITEIERILLDPARLALMSDKNLIALYRTVLQREGSVSKNILSITEMGLQNERFRQWTGMLKDYAPEQIDGAADPLTVNPKMSILARRIRNMIEDKINEEGGT